MDAQLMTNGEAAFGDALNDALGDGGFAKALISVAWAKVSGVSLLYDAAQRFIARGGTLHVNVGVDHRGTSLEALLMLLNLVADSAESRIVHNAHPACTFHRKVYIFLGEERSRAFVGSANLTMGGLYTNDEVMLRMDLSATEDGDVVEQLLQAHEACSALPRELALPLTLRNVRRLAEAGYLAPERPAATSSRPGSGRTGARAIFGSRTPRFPGTRPAASGTEAVQGILLPEEGVPAIGLPPRAEAAPAAFVMVMTGFDATRRRGHSPDILLPKRARDDWPAFWPEMEQVRGDKHLHEEAYVSLCVITNNQQVQTDARIYTHPSKSEFRLNCAELQQQAGAGDILFLGLADADDCDYVAVVVREGTDVHAQLLNLCVHRASAYKTWGFVT